MPQMNIEATDARPNPSPESPNGATKAPNTAFKDAINRFWADRVKIKGPKQETIKPEKTLFEGLNGMSQAVLGFARHRFLPSKPDASELKQYGIEAQYVPKEERSLTRKFKDKVTNIALRKIPTDWYHRRSDVTAPSKDGEFVRTLATRAVRARIYKDLKKIPKENKDARQKLIDEAHTRDKLARDFLNQSEITVHVMEGSEPLGEQTARYVILEPPVREGQAEKPPIFLIPGISNDLDSVSGLAQELAYSGRKVVTVAYPDTRPGKVTQEFAKAVKESSHFEPHTAFNEAAIDKLLPEGEFDLWVFSTGGPIGAEILNDPKYQNRVSNAVLLAPASSVDQSTLSAGLGLAHELAELKSTGHRYSLVIGARNLDIPKEANAARGAVSSGLAGKVIKSMPDLYEGAKVKEGGKIIVISEEKDEVTKSKKAEGIFSRNPQMEHIILEGAYHNTAVIEPERVIMRVNQLQSPIPQEV